METEALSIYNYSDFRKFLNDYQRQRYVTKSEKVSVRFKAYSEDNGRNFKIQRGNESAGFEPVLQIKTNLSAKAHIVFYHLFQQLLHGDPQILSH